MVLPGVVQQQLSDTIGQQNDYLQQLAGNVDQAQQQAQLISQYRLTAPHLPAGVYSALASAGVDPNGPDFSNIVQKYIPTTDSNTVGYSAGQIASLPKTQMSKGNDGLIAGLNPDGTFRLAAQGEQGIAPTPAMLQQIGPQGRQAYFGARFKSMGLPSSSDNPLGGVADAVVGAVKTGVRWGGGTLYSGLEAIQNVGTIAESDLMGHPRPFNTDTLANALWYGTTLGQSIEHGGGNGWVLNPGAQGSEDKTLLQRDIRGSVTDPNGNVHAASIGRNLAGAATPLISGSLSAEQYLPQSFRTFTQPTLHIQPRNLSTPQNQLIYNAVSGLADAEVALKLDPAKPVTDLYQNLKAARSTINVAQAADTAETATATPQSFRSTLMNGLKQWVHPDFQQVADGSRGQKLFAALANETDPLALRTAVGGKWDATPLLYKTIAEETDPEIIKKLFTDAVMSGQVTNWPTNGLVTGLGGTTNMLKAPFRDTRLAGMMPGRVVNFDDPENVVQWVDRASLNAKLPYDQRSRLFTDALGVFAAPQIDRPAMLHSFLGDYKNTLMQHLMGQEWWGSDAGETFARGLIRGVDSDPSNADSFVADALRNQFPGKPVSNDTVDTITNLVTSSKKFTAGDEEMTRLDALMAHMRVVGPDLGHGYGNESLATHVAKYLTDSTAENRKYLLAAEQPGGIPAIHTPDGPVQATGPTSWAMLHRSSELMEDPRDVRRMTSMFRNVMFGHNPFITDTGDTRWWLNALDTATNLWRTATVLSPRLGLRYMMNSQAELGLADMNGIAHDPLRTIGQVIADKSYGTAFEHGGNDIFGESIADLNNKITNRMAAAMGTDAKGNLRQDLAITSKMGELARGDNGYTGGWAHNINQIYNDPVSREAAKTVLTMRGSEGVPGAVDAARQALRDSYWDGPLSDFRKGFASAGGWREPLLNDRTYADAYLDDLVLRPIDEMSVGKPGLLEAMATGKYNGVPLGDGKAWNADLLDQLKGLSRSGEGPDRLIGPQPLAVKANAASDTAKGIRAFTDTMFNKLVGRPMANTKADAMKQFYDQAITDHFLPLATDKDRAAILDALQTGNTQQFDTAATASGKMTAQEIDTAAKTIAARKVRDMFLDMHQRSQFGDMIRLISPFADHWRQLAKNWATVGLDNAPRLAERVTQLHGWTENNGGFYTNQYGDLAYHAPLSGMAISALTGDQSADMTSPATGLSLVTEGLPGIGGTLAIPAHMAFQAIPGASDVEKQLLPFGAPDTSKGILESFAPAWAQKIITAIRQPEGQRDYMGQLNQSMAYYQARYPDKYPHTPEGHAALYKDASTLTRKLFLMRGIAQFLLPSAPTIDQKVSVGDKSVEAWRIAADYQNSILPAAYKNGGTTADAVANFVTKYGENNALLMVPESHSPIYGLGATQATQDWQRNNNGLVNAYPDTWALFAPNANDTKNFSYYDYGQQFAQGDRQLLDWKDRVALSEYRIGAMIYDRERSKAGPNPNAQQQQALQTIKFELGQTYPGYYQNNYAEPGPTRISGDQLVNEVATAANDPRMGNNQTANAVRIYMNYRMQALEALRPGVDPGLLSGQSLGANAAASYRSALQQIGADLVKNVPSFAPTWDSVFSHEVQG